MFTEINDKLYLDNHSMTVLMADMVRDYAQGQQQEDLEDLTAPHITFMDAEALVERFRKTWRRPRDGSNMDLKKMYKSVPDGLKWAVERELERRADAEQADKYRKLLDAVFNPDTYEDDMYLDGHNDEDLF
jgi:hypothetical protein